MATKTWTQFYGETVAASLSPTDIAAAITAAGVNGVVRLPAGTATLTAALVPLAGQTIVGAGRRATTLLVAIGAAYNGFTVSADDVTIRDLTIDGQYALQTYGQSQTTGCGIYVTGARLTVRDCNIVNPLNMGISATSGAADLTVLRCRITNLGTAVATAGGYYKGIYGNGTARVRILDCYFEGWSQAIGLWFGNKDCLVRGNYLINNYGFEDLAHTVNRSAIEDYGATTAANARNVFEGNYVDGSTHNCFEIAQGNQGCRYVNNTTRNPGGTGGAGHHIEVTGDSPGNTTDILIAHNTCYGDATKATAQGIVVNGTVARIDVSHNTLRDFAHASATGAIFVGGLGVTGSVAVAHNQLTNCTYGIWLNSNPGGLIVADNVIEASSTTAVAIYIISGAGHTIGGNEIRFAASAGSGIGIQATTGNHIITGNTIITDNGPCINLSSSNNRVENNVLTSLTYGGYGKVNLTGAASRNNVRGNICSTANYDIQITGTGDYNIWQDNLMRGAFGSFSNVTSSGTHNITEPNHEPTFQRAMTGKLLAAQTVNIAQVTLPHGLGYAPTEVYYTMTTTGNIWRSAVADATNIYYSSDANGRVADFYVR